MVDKQALQSVLNVPAPNPDDYMQTHSNGIQYVILVNRRWPEYLAEYEDEELAAIPYEFDNDKPLEGCKRHDVGWMKVAYGYAQIQATLDVHTVDHWRIQYRQPPEIGFQF
ncbi:uncharacterized protein BDV14DRAFT_194856 [Aspergillus stella-maris]|uniref:uncharacterized protein n=1 Tax=Aspergillus stella-maris TaxID=1810926 RepID=UPI003CCE446B